MDASNVFTSKLKEDQNFDLLYGANSISVWRASLLICFELYQEVCIDQTEHGLIDVVEDWK